MEKRIKYQTNIVHWLLCICIVIMLLPIHAYAASDKEEYRLTLNNGAGEGLFYFYKVADFSELGEFEIEEKFQKYIRTVKGMEKIYNGEELSSEEWSILAETLAGCVEQDDISATEILETKDQTLTWTQSQGLEKALYLILGKPMEADAQYTLLPYLITVPNRDETGQWISQVTVDLTKFSQEISETYKVLKIWKDEGNEKKRPAEIEVELLRDGETLDTQVLDEDNNWQFIWSGLETGHEWKVVEKEVPDSYVMSNTLNGQTFVIVNEYKSSGTTTSNSGLPQTGQLWWPVPIFAIVGILLFMIGWIRRKESMK